MNTPDTELSAAVNRTVKTSGGKTLISVVPVSLSSKITGGHLRSCWACGCLSNEYPGHRCLLSRENLTDDTGKPARCYELAVGAARPIETIWVSSGQTL